jgi:hypothetical protein
LNRCTGFCRPLPNHSATPPDHRVADANAKCTRARRRAVSASRTYGRAAGRSARGVSVARHRRSHVLWELAPVKDRPTIFRRGSRSDGSEPKRWKQVVTLGFLCEGSARGLATAEGNLASYLQQHLWGTRKVSRVAECHSRSESRSTRRSPAPHLQPAHQRADALGMESWDEWETEIQERLAELTKPEPERERRWVSIGSAETRTTEGVARFRAFLSRVKREWIVHGPRV